MKKILERYLIGIVAVTIFADDGGAEFSSVSAAMFTAFRCFTDGCAATDGTPLQEPVVGPSRLEVYGCPSKLYSKWLGSMGYNLLINRVYWGYNPVTNHLLTSWDIQDIGLL